MRRPVSGSGPAMLHPVTSRSGSSPHRVRVRPPASPPPQDTWSVSTSTPVVKVSRLSEVSTVSATIGTSAMGSRTALRMMRPIEVEPCEFATV